MANETNSRENVGAGLMDALMGGAMGEELPSAADGDDLLRLALSSTGIGPVETEPLDTPVDDSVFLEVDPLTVTGTICQFVTRCHFLLSFIFTQYSRTGCTEPDATSRHP